MIGLYVLNAGFSIDFTSAHFVAFRGIPIFRPVLLFSLLMFAMSKQPPFVGVKKYLCSDFIILKTYVLNFLNKL